MGQARRDSRDVQECKIGVAFEADLSSPTILRCKSNAARMYEHMPPERVDWHPEQMGTKGRTPSDPTHTHTSSHDMHTHTGVTCVTQARHYRVVAGQPHPASACRKTRTIQSRTNDSTGSALTRQHDSTTETQVESLHVVP